MQNPVKGKGTRETREFSQLPITQLRDFSNPKLQHDEVSTNWTRTCTQLIWHRSGRAPFTADDDALLIKYIAKYNPAPQGRLGQALYKILVENVSPV